MTSSRPRSKALHIALWVVQILLALMFGVAGVMKSTRPIADLAAMMVWPGAIPPALVRFIGVSELAGAIGLIFPAATRIRPGLTPLAALGLVVVQVLAIGFHVTRGEFSVIPMNLVLAALAAFVTWGRGRRAVISSRRSVPTNTPRGQT